MEVPWENVAEAALKERKARVASDKTSYTDCEHAKINSTARGIKLQMMVRFGRVLV
jgi:hypothetical protein